MKTEKVRPDCAEVQIGITAIDGLTCRPMSEPRWSPGICPSAQPCISLLIAQNFIRDINMPWYYLTIRRLKGVGLHPLWISGLLHVTLEFISFQTALHKGVSSGGYSMLFCAFVSRAQPGMSSGEWGRMACRRHLPADVGSERGVLPRDRRVNFKVKFVQLGE